MELLDTEAFALPRFEMKPRIVLYSILAFNLLVVAGSLGLGSQEIPVLVDKALTTPGSPPFHVKADITDGSDPFAEVEEYWFAPNRW